MSQFQQSVTTLFMKHAVSISSRMRGLVPVVAAALFLVVTATPVNAEDEHAGAPLAKLIEKNDCILRKDDQIVTKLADAGISVREFQDQTASLFKDGYLRSEEQGQVLRLVGWGDCE